MESKNLSDLAEYVVIPIRNTKSFWMQILLKLTSHSNIKDPNIPPELTIFKSSLAANADIPQLPAIGTMIPLADVKIYQRHILNSSEPYIHFR